jgi:hypothetical protein
MSSPTPKPRWYHFAPARFFAGLLVVQVFLFLSERFQWFPFNQNKGWTVLIALGVVFGAVLVMLVWGLVSLLFRRRFQFLVQSLLVFLVTISVPLGWFAWEMEKARRQREAVEVIVGMGGEAYYDYEDDEDGEIVGGEPTTPSWLRKLFGNDFFCGVVWAGCRDTEFGDDDVKTMQGLTHLHTLLLSDTQITDNGLERLKEMTSLRWVVLSNTQVTDKGLSHLAGMRDLEGLSLNGTLITDNGLAHLKQMTELRVLRLERTQITDDGVGELTELKKLEWLFLDNTQVTDKGLAHLERMTELEHLRLLSTQITDDGLEHIRGMTKLDMLEVFGTQVTDEGISRLRQALPNCQIRR